ncbi:hypothetical protein ACA910_020767 [Epithemia clementina (nom. ined.)]
MGIATVSPVRLQRYLGQVGNSNLALLCLGWTEETLEDEVEQRLSPHKNTTTTHACGLCAKRLVVDNAVQAHASLAAALQQDNGCGVEFTVPQALETGYWTLTPYFLMRQKWRTSKRTNGVRGLQ